MEEQVRRKVHTSSTSQVAVIRGFEVFPPAINFGILKEGCTYSVECTLKNIGIDTCRFKFKNPPPSTGIKIYYTPGSVSVIVGSDTYHYIMFRWLLVCQENFRLKFLH